MISIENNAKKIAGVGFAVERGEFTAKERNFILNKLN